MKKVHTIRVTPLRNEQSRSFTSRSLPGNLGLVTHAYDEYSLKGPELSASYVGVGAAISIRIIILVLSYIFLKPKFWTFYVAPSDPNQVTPCLVLYPRPLAQRNLNVQIPRANLLRTECTNMSANIPR